MARQDQFAVFDVPADVHGGQINGHGQMQGQQYQTN